MISSHRSRLLVTLWILLAVAGCTKPPGRRGSITGPLTPQEESEAQALFVELVASASAGRWTEAHATATTLLGDYPGFRDEADALLVGSRAARGVRDLRQAEQWLVRLVEDHEKSAKAVEGWWELAALRQDAGRWADEADSRVRFYDRADRDDPRREATRSRLRELLELRLSTAEIDQLARDHPRSVVGSTATWLAARRSYDEGADPVEVAERLQVFLEEYPESGYADDARSLLSEIGRRYGVDTPPGLNVARSDRIGLLSPLSGEYASLGQAMFDGALLAIEQHNRAMLDSLQLVSRDTRGDEVVAVQGARELIEEEGAIAIVGALLSPSTVAVAVLCQERRVPLVSPTATKETITEIGDYVFQTNLTKAIEARLVARAGVQALLRTRYAILYPDGEDGRTIADLFTAEVERLGGRVVARESFQRDTTDFGQVIERLRRAGPEALFLPVGVSELRLIAPQLVFHDLQVQLLGTSSWNNSLLTREVGDNLERAVFPSDLALIPEAERDHFEEQWRRRFRGTASNPFALKTWFAVRNVIAGLDPQSAVTRERLREAIAMDLDRPGGPGAAAAGMDRLRMIQGRNIERFPVEMFPSLVWTRVETPPMVESSSELEDR